MASFKKHSQLIYAKKKKCAKWLMCFGLGGWVLTKKKKVVVIIKI